MPQELASLSDYDAAISKAGSKLVVIDFHATWCGPCIAIAPYYEQLSNQYKSVVFLKCDVDKARDVASKFSVSAMPTFVFLKNGQKVHQIKGADKNSLKSTIEKFGSGTGATAGHQWGKGNTLSDSAPNSAPLTASIPSVNQVSGFFNGLDNNAKIGLLIFGAYLLYLLL